MDEPQCQGCRERDQVIAELQRRVAALEAQVERLTKLLEEAQRAGKRQAAPFAKKEPKKDPKTPGRKAGDDYGTKAYRQPPPAEEIDEVLDAPLPEVCPCCGGRIEELYVDHQYQTEIPRKPIHRQFDIHIGHCGNCGKRIQGRHALQTSNALGAAAAQLGPDAQAAVVELNKQAGLSHGKVSECFQRLFGISLCRGGSAQVMLRAGRRCETVYADITQSVHDSEQVVLDETGWRVGGRSAWLHGVVGDTATVYVIDPTRSGVVAENILGRDYAGVMVHDGWSPYDNFRKARHQQCLQHLLRRCHELLETAVGGAVRFPRHIKVLLQSALALRNLQLAGTVNKHGLAVSRGRLAHALEKAVAPLKTNAANERLAQHLDNHQDDLFTFLKIPGVDATNWRAELAMRFGVILRKVWGGNRTWKGARAQAILMSLWRTCWQRGVSALDFLSQLLRRGIIPLPASP